MLTDDPLLPALRRGAGRRRRRLSLRAVRAALIRCSGASPASSTIRRCGGRSGCGGSTTTRRASSRASQELQREAEARRSAAAHAAAAAADRERVRAAARGGRRRCSSRSTRAPTSWPRAAIPSRPEPAPQPPILECYEHVFRDWAWGERECALALDFVTPLVPSGPRAASRSTARAPGGSRSTSTRRARPARTLALDVNPLPFLVADRLLARRDRRPARVSRSTRTPTTSSSSRATSSARSSCATGSRSCSPTRSARRFRPGRWTRS